jgi:hypothetical protein
MAWAMSARHTCPPTNTKPGPGSRLTVSLSVSPQIKTRGCGARRMTRVPNVGGARRDGRCSHDSHGCELIRIVPRTHGHACAIRRAPRCVYLDPPQPHLRRCRGLLRRPFTDCSGPLRRGCPAEARGRTTGFEARFVPHSSQHPTAFENHLESPGRQGEISMPQKSPTATYWC